MRRHADSRSGSDGSSSWHPLSPLSRPWPEPQPDWFWPSRNDVSRPKEGRPTVKITVWALRRFFGDVGRRGGPPAQNACVLLSKANYRGLDLAGSRPRGTLETLSGNCCCHNCLQIELQDGAWARGIRRSSGSALIADMSLLRKRPPSNSCVLPEVRNKHFSDRQGNAILSVTHVRQLPANCYS